MENGNLHSESHQDLPDDLKLADLSIEDQTQDVPTPSRAVDDVLQRSHALIKELEGFASHLQSLKKQSTVELRTFRNEVKSEIKFLERLAASQASVSAENTLHSVNSSNLPFYESVWAAAKRSSGLIALRRWFYWDIPSSSSAEARARSTKRRSASGRPRKNGVLVDIVTEDGAQWIKVSTVTETRLLFELAKKGWENDALSDDDSDDLDDGRIRDDDDDDEVSIVQTAEDLARAAKEVRVHYRNPKIRFVLPRISRQNTLPEVETLIRTVEGFNIAVQTSEDIPSPPSLKDALPTLLVNDFKSFTPTLNVDCTLLLALVSDISHTNVTEESWFPYAVKRQIEIERDEHLLPELLYPAMGNRELLCTEEAAKRMREIVETIGTETERARTALLMGDEGKSQEQILSGIRQYSDHAVPSDWQLPIKVVSKDAGDVVLPLVASKIAAELTDINQSVFLYGWASGHTTISSNGTVAKQIERIIEDDRKDDEDIVGPRIWLCPVSRSLVAKKGRGDHG